MTGQDFDRAYQRPLPGLEHFGANPELPVGHLFKHPESRLDVTHWSLMRQNYPTTQMVRTDALRPTQPSVDEPYLYSEDRRGPNPDDRDLPGAVKTKSGEYRLADGHHHVARNLLNGTQFTKVQVWHA